MIETHAHLDTDRYDEDRDSVIKNALKNGVKKIINVSSDLSSLKKVKTLSMEYEEVYITFGIQPHSAYEFDDEILEIISTIAKEEKVVAIGEIGLDYHYNFSLPEIQRKVFREQIRMAKNLKLPLVIHMRESFEDTLEILKEEKACDTGGVIHCFTEDIKKGQVFIDMGFYLGIGGAVTFKNTKLLQEAVEKFPLERLLLETDSPYMTPVPHRGKRNEPAFLKFIAEKIAQLKKIEVEEVKEITTKNAMKLFGI